jgi:hypothetical protein
VLQDTERKQLTTAASENQQLAVVLLECRAIQFESLAHANAQRPKISKAINPNLSLN